jgi:RNA polymerase sigma factor (sigma-70 family)
VSALDVHKTIEAVWRIESAKIIGGLTRVVRDVGIAEELAQDALVAALETWPASGIPDNPGAWLMTTAKRRGIDRIRRGRMQERKHEQIARALEALQEEGVTAMEAAADDRVGDDLLRLIFIACHPILPADARVALTLRLLGGLTTDEIARAFLASEGAIAQRIVRAKKNAGRGLGPLRGSAREGPGAPPLVGARRGLSDLQRGLLGDGGRRLGAAIPVRRGAAPGPDPRGARSE